MPGLSSPVQQSFTKARVRPASLGISSNMLWRRRGFKTTRVPREDGKLGPDGTPKRRKRWTRIRSAWSNNRPRLRPFPFYALPLSITVALLSTLTYQNYTSGDRADIDILDGEDGEEHYVKVRGAWNVHVLGALPLRSLSRLWGYLNSFELPVWSRAPGYKLYSWAFGCNLTELKEPNLSTYASLGEFFYRELKEGARPIAEAPLVSPADGKLLHFGQISGRRVEQVKGMTYSLDALLGKGSISNDTLPKKPEDIKEVVREDEFANINDIDYTLDDLLGSTSADESLSSTPSSHPSSRSSRSGSISPAGSTSSKEDVSVPDTTSLLHDANVALSLGSAASPTASKSHSPSAVKEGNSLYFMVIYLAPGDYHRFHSPASWVVEKRRHFAGELFSVSPWIARRVQGLFVLNERVALLGRWKYGFFSMIPVGATNVGSIKVNFDQDLRTNNRRRPDKAGTYVEALYTKASALLRGQPLSPGEEMGGFKLGSTIILVFEAPDKWKWAVEEGAKVRVGQALGYLPGLDGANGEAAAVKKD